MTAPADVGFAALVGGMAGAVVLLASVVAFQTLDFLDRAEWVDGATRYDRARATVKMVPRYTYDRTDWQAVAWALPGAVLVGVVLAALVRIFLVGVREVFLA